MSVTSFIGRLVARLPEQLIRVLPAAAFRFSPAEIPAELPVSTASRRLLVAPVNFAGQGFQWAHCAEKIDTDTHGENMVYVARADAFNFEADLRVPLPVYMWSRRWQKAHRAHVLANMTHVLVEAERPIYSGPFRSSLLREVREMQAAGISVAAVCHGSDIRLPSRHAAEFAESPLTKEFMPTVARLEADVRARARVLARMNVPTFVSTPDLLRDVPGATWLPVVVDVDAWSAPKLALQGKGKLVVAHAPSKAAVKGTDAIEPTLRKLEAEGLIEYRAITGVPHADMPTAFAQADVVLDQFRLASYGVAASEAMAAGRLVVSHISAQVRDHVKSATGLELPIVQATAPELEGVLRSIAADRAAYRATAVAGQKFAQQVHDGTFSAKVLAGFLGV